SNRDINDFVIDDIDIEEVIPDIVVPENRVDKPMASGASTSTAVKNGTFYKVQLAASSKKIEESPSNFKNLPKISRVRIGNLYKYFTGAEATESAARELLATAKSKGYTEAFIVIEKNGVISKL
ncbi:MAG: SPOR domain-containing protein, partial [Nonlabens sp.]|nr:SPOR domain-containing protein [Nonlabens sp.]